MAKGDAVLVPGEAPRRADDAAGGDAGGPAAPDPPLRSRAALAGLGLGALGFALDGLAPSVAAGAGVRLSLAGACVFVAVLTQGRFPGLLAALIAYSRALGPDTLPLYVLRVLEPLGASLLLGRTGSLVLSVTLYWLGAGAWLGLAAARALRAPGVGELAGMLLAGLLNAWIAEALVRLVPPAAPEAPGRGGIRRMLVGWSAWGVALPGLLLAVVGLRGAASRDASAPSLPAAAVVLGLLLLTIAASSAAVGWAGQRLSGALEGVLRAARQVASGDVTGRVALGELAAEPIREVRKVGAQFAQMHEALAYYDPQTGLPNRKLLLDRLALAAAQALPLRQGFALLLVDLDRFRVLDAALGRRLSNVLLERIAQRLRSCVRPGDTVARVGGDEFGLLVPGMDSMEAASQMALKVMDDIRAPFVLESRDVVVTASIGISLFPRDGQDAETLLSNATAASYVAKERGQDSYRRYTARITARDARRLQVESGLRRALEQADLVVHYQPILDLRTGVVQRMEALVRWQRPDVGLVGPREFIPVAESSGLIVAIGSFVLREACARVKSWSERGHRCGVAINLSARQLQRPELVDELAQALRSAQMDPALLEIEVTEGTALQDVERTVQTLGQLRAQGVSVAVDDFGTGYSSLSYLKRLPLDWVKLDQSFVADLTRSPDDAAIPTAVIAMAHSLKLLVVAEGVETQEQLAFLRQLGCDSMQGHLFSPAVPAAEADRLLDEGRRLAPEHSS